MPDNRPVGVFDSGVGGLTVLRTIHDRLPRESTIYVGDLRYFPYGPRRSEEVRRRACAIGRYLEHRGVKTIVVACNTATSAALDTLGQTLAVPVIGVVRPGAEEALRRSDRGIIGVVGTEGTVRSQAYAHALRALDPSVTVHQRACGRLVDLVEMGAAGSEEASSLIEGIVHDFVEDRRCDTIILGCTHFPLVKPVFEAVAGGRATIVDSASSTAHTTQSVLDHLGLVATDETPSHQFLVTGAADTFTEQARLLFGEHVDATEIAIQDQEPVAMSAQELLTG